MKSCVTCIEWWNGVRISCLCPEFKQHSTFFLHGPLLSCRKQQQKCWAAFQVDRQHGDITVCVTLWHIPPQKGLPEFWIVLFPSSHLGTNQLGLAGRGSHALQILELCGFQAHPGKDSNAWTDPVPTSPAVTSCS